MAYAGVPIVYTNIYGGGANDDMDSYEIQLAWVQVSWRESMAELILERSKPSQLL